MSAPMLPPGHVWAGMTAEEKAAALYEACERLWESHIRTVANLTSEIKRLENEITELKKAS